MRYFMLFCIPNCYSIRFKMHILEYSSYKVYVLPDIDGTKVKMGHEGR